MTDLTPVINAVIGLCMALITAFAVPWLKSKLTAQDAETLIKWVQIAVEAAEQLYTSKDGDKKKAYVLDYLEDKGYTVDGADVENAVEAAVLKLHTDLYGVSE